MRIKLLRDMGEGFAEGAVVEADIGMATAWLSRGVAVPENYVARAKVITTAADDVEVLGKAPMKPPKNRMAVRTVTK